jgi:hypothetical protein
VFKCDSPFSGQADDAANCFGDHALFIRPNDADMTRPDCCGITPSLQALRMAQSRFPRNPAIAKSGAQWAAFSPLFWLEGQEIDWRVRGGVGGLNDGVLLNPLHVQPTRFIATTARSIVSRFSGKIERNYD